MNIGWLVAAVLTGIFAIAQILQLLGVIGIGFSIAGAGITAGAIALSAVCFKKAFSKAPQ